MIAFVVISPATNTRPVVTRVSQATRAVGSSAKAASSTASEIWSDILSGCPSVTDSEVNRYPDSVVKPTPLFIGTRISCGKRPRRVTVRVCECQDSRDYGLNRPDSAVCSREVHELGCSD